MEEKITANDGAYAIEENIYLKRVGVGPFNSPKMNHFFYSRIHLYLK